MFMPYRNAAKDSLKRARLSCMSWSCMKLDSRSAIASLSSAKSSCRSSSGVVVASRGPLTRWALSRREERDDGRRGVVGRERGDLERVRR
jgi:hypothetical protein